MINTLTTEERRKLFYLQALLETIVEMGDEGAPSGVCYMVLTEHGVDLELYRSFLDGLKSVGLITESGHVLRATQKAKDVFKTIRN